MDQIILFLKSVGFMIPVLLAVALLTLIERKILGYMQFRKGPKMVGPYGLFQPLADGFKLLIKEAMKPSKASPYMFYVSPMLFFLLAMMLWSIMPVGCAILKFSLSLMVMLGLSSLSVYSLLGSGWASNSKYSFLGGVRAVAQTMSYEMSLGLILLSVVVFSGGFKLKVMENSQESCWLMVVCLPLFFIWFMSTLAETNRAPFDLTEGESEMVSGYKVEYSGGPFALFFMAEYSNMMFMNLLSVILFMGGGCPVNKLFPLKVMLVSMKTGLLTVGFLWIRASYPRFRYDQLMYLTWKKYLPLSLGLLIYFSVLLMLVKGLPYSY